MVAVRVRKRGTAEGHAEPFAQGLSVRWEGNGEALGSPVRAVPMKEAERTETRERWRADERRVREV